MDYLLQLPGMQSNFKHILTSWKMFENIIPGENENNQSKVTLGVGRTFIHGLLSGGRDAN